MVRLRWMCAVAVAALLVTAGLAATRASAAGKAELKLTGPSSPQTTAAPFDVTVSISRADVTWAGYSVQIAYDRSVLQVKNVARLPLASCDDGSWGVAGDPAQTPTLVVACVFQQSTATGPADTVTFQCLKNGTSELHLVTLSEDSIRGSTLLDENAVNIPTDLVDAQDVTCGAGGPVSTVAIPTNPPQSAVETAIAGGPSTPVPGSTQAAQATAARGTVIAAATSIAQSTPNPTEIIEAKTPGSPAQQTATARSEVIAANNSAARIPGATGTAQALGRSNDTSSGGDSNSGLIVGIIVGAAVIALAAAGGVMLWRRRQAS